MNGNSFETVEIKKKCLLVVILQGKKSFFLRKQTMFDVSSLKKEWEQKWYLKMLFKTQNLYVSP